MNDITAEIIKELATDRKNINLTLHSLDRFRERGIHISDIQNVLLYGEIIEQYPDDYPFPSCLELGLSIANRPLHVCCGVGDNKLWIITAYYPDNSKWESDNKTRKAVE